MGSNISRWMANKRYEISLIQKDLDSIEAIQKHIPDLSFNIDCYNVFKLLSETICPIATDVEIDEPECDWNDDTLFACPFAIVNGRKIFAAERFAVGTRTYDGDIPFDYWDTKMSEKNVPQAVIKKVEEFFMNSTAKKYDDPEPFI